MKLIIMALLCASIYAAEPAKPKPLSEAEKLELARLQLQIVSTQAQTERFLSEAKERLQSLDKQHADMMAKLRTSAGADTACGLNDKQDWVCPPPKPEVKK